MQKLILIMSSFLLFSVTSLQADPDKGQRYFTKKLKKVCDLTGAEFAELHTQEQWKEIHSKENGIITEIKKVCPKVRDSALKDKYIEHYFDFFYHYGNDSGNIPSC